VGQGIAEQFRVEKVVRFLETPIFGGRDRLWHIYIVDRKIEKRAEVRKKKHYLRLQLAAELGRSDLAIFAQRPKK
jgi:hypothetical protein